MNFVVFVGNLGRDVEVKTSGDTKIANGAIAVSVFKKKEKVTLWVNFTAFNKTADVLQQYTKKGSKIGIQGELAEDEYTAKDGSQKKKTYVLVNKVELLSGKNDIPEQTTSAPKEESISDTVGEDEIPF